VPCVGRRRSAPCRAALVALLALLPLLSTAQAGPVMEREIAGLLQAVGSSGCEFMRGGIAYLAEQAQAHLRAKYDYLAARGQLASAEDFIDKAASRSSMLGEDYFMRCTGTAPLRSEQWMRARLKALRQAPGP
jgi:Family of unknown function (DUF5329)